MREVVVMVLTGLLAAGLLGGCFRVQARAPERVSVFGEDIYKTAPASDVPAAGANDGAGLQRENAQLRERVRWLNEQISKLQNKQRDVQQDQAEVRQEIERLTIERDRYKRQLQAS